MESKTKKGDKRQEKIPEPGTKKEKQKKKKREKFQNRKEEAQETIWASLTKRKMCRMVLIVIRKQKI